MSISVGIVGLPNVGKSTLFQALTKKEVHIANYPFATIDPNVGVVEVPDTRLLKLAELFHSAKVIPAIVEFVDIAGLVKGANKGEGLGNQFLSSIREVAAIAEVVRCFENEDIVHVEKTVDPIRDLDIIHTELLLKDLETIQKRLDNLESEVRAGKKEALLQYPILQKLQKEVEQGISARVFLKQNAESEEHVRDLHLLTAKPFLVICNGSEIPPQLQKRIEEMEALAVALNVKEELEIALLSQEEQQELGAQSHLGELIQKAYALLHLITFFTAGEKETRAWTIREGSTAPQAGGVIHSDFEEKFIKAEIIPWNELLEAGGYTGAAQKGLLRTEGKEYIMKDGDVIEIKHG